LLEYSSVTHDHCGLNEDVLGEDAHSRRIFYLFILLRCATLGMEKKKGDEMLVG